MTTIKDVKPVIGYIDVGGGMRAVYGAGVLDRLIDDNIVLDYYLGVSAGSANIISYLGGHRGRTLRFYREYSFRPEYMSFRNWVKTKSYISLDYIYSTMTNEGSEDPLDFETAKSKKCKFYTVATEAKTGKACYFDFENTEKNNHYELKASCCIPIVCKPFEYNNVAYFDGGISDPVPIQKALDDGCEKVIVVLTLPLNFKKKHKVSLGAFKRLLKDYPESAKLMYTMVDKYNENIEQLKALQQEGKVLIIAPDDCCGVNTLKRNKDNLTNLYNKGYKDAEKIKAFIEGKT